MNKTLVAASVLVAMHTAIAHAQPGQTIAASSSDAPGMTAAPDSSAERDTLAEEAPSPLARRSQEATSQRSYFGSTALTTPRGKVELGYRTVIPIYMGVASASMGLTDRIEVSVDGAWLLERDAPTAVNVSAKAQVIRGKNGALAIRGGALRVGEDGDTVSIPWVGAVASTCVGEKCAVLASAHVTAFSIGADEDMTIVPIVAGGSAILGSGGLKLVLDVTMAGDDGESGAAVYGGLRLAGRHASFDAGVATAGGIALPFFGIALRP
jgi:hypothetical protein